MTIDEAPSETPPQHAHDFSNVQGLQVVGAHPGAVEDPASDAWREALKLELEARAARFHQSVDASLVLSDDGVIRWLGDPVARLAAGPDLLTPRALILADASLPEGARAIVAARLELWLAALAKRLLGPLLALRSLQEEPEPVRQVATRISDSLGVLEREPLRSQIKALDQNSRAALRRHGVRFGAHYIYVPQSLKPGARALALQLWSVRLPDTTGEETARALLPLASSGRTSLPLDSSISKDGYRVAGFRPCGERVVRVDIVERLSDMIRAAFVACSPADSAHPTGAAFVVNGHMTSLTGCSGETFASILRSLGYESFEIERSRLTPPQNTVKAGPADSPPPADGSVVEASASEAEQPAAGDAVEVGAAEAVPDSPGNEQEQPSAGDAPDVAAAPAAEASASGAEQPVDGGAIGVEAAGAGAVHDSPESEEEQPSDGETPDIAVDLAHGPDDEADDPAPAPEANPEEADRAQDDRVAAPQPAESAPVAEAVGSEAGGTPVETKIIAWRLARRPRPERPKRRFRRGEAPGAPPPRGRESGNVDSTGRQAQVERRSDGSGRASQERESPPDKRERFNRADEKRRKNAPNKNAPRPNALAPVAQFESRRAASVDPDSPFAKLLELRTALEKQGKNR